MKKLPALIATLALLPLVAPGCRQPVGNKSLGMGFS